MREERIAIKPLKGAMLSFFILAFYRMRTVKATLPVLLGEVWLRFPLKLQRICVTVRS